MINNNLSAVDVASVLQSIAFVLFFAFFIVATVWAFRSKKDYNSHMSQLPLNDDELFHHSTKK